MFTFVLVNILLVRSPVGQSQRLVELRLQVQPVHLQYCRSDDNTGVLQLQSRFEFTNVSRRPIIVYKGSGHIDGIMVASSLADLAADRLLPGLDWVTHGDPMTAGKPMLAVQITESDGPGACGFVVLLPGETFHGDELVLLPYRRAGTVVPHFLDPGRYFLQVKAATWPDYALVLSRPGGKGKSAPVEKELYGRWKTWGDLWVQPSLTSQPFSITIEEHPAVKSCK